MNVYRSATGAGGWILIAALPAHTVTYTDNGLIPNTPYFYLVTAFDAIGESLASNMANATTLLLGTPSNLATTPLSSGAIKLNWVDNSGGLAVFTVQRSFTLGFGTITTVTILAPGITTYVDGSKLFPATTYYYRISAQIGLSPPTLSNIAIGTTLAGAWRPITPSSASLNGISNIANANASHVSMATDDLGRCLVAWQQDVNGINQIYAMFLNPSDTDSGGNPLGWQPIAVNLVKEGEAQDPVNGQILSITYSTKQLSNEGGGISLAAGDAENPVVVWDAYSGSQASTAATDSVVISEEGFAIFWQEVRNGFFRIVGRRIANFTYNNIPGAGFYFATFSDQLSFSPDVSGAPNFFYGSAYTVGLVTSGVDHWVVDNLLQTEDEINPHVVEATVGANHNFYLAWQEFIPLVSYPFGTYQIWGSQNTAPGVVNPFGTLGVNGGFAITNAWLQYSTGTSAGAGDANSSKISTAAANNNATNPTIAVNNVGPHIYVAWQQYLPAAVPPNWDIFTATDAAAPANMTNNTGDSEHPNLALGSNGLPILVWEDNTPYGNGIGCVVAPSTAPLGISNQFQIYAAQGTAAGIWGLAPQHDLFDSTFVPGTSITGTDPSDILYDPNCGLGGISHASGSSPQLPVQAMSGNDIYVAWQDLILGHSNIYLKKYATGVPTEGPDWVGLADSDIYPGVSNTLGNAFLPTISVAPGNIIDVLWQDTNLGTIYSIYGVHW